MKLFKTLALGALALAVASVASATTVKVTGSTAYRKALYASIINRLGSGTVKAAYVGSSLSGANQVTFTNGTDTVQCCMAGSVGGINWIVNGTNVATSIGGNTAQAWISVTSANAAAVGSIGAAPGYAITGGTPFGGSGQPAVTWDAASKADFTMSDSLQDSTPYSSGVTGVTLTQSGAGAIGVVEFMFAKGTQAPNIPASSYTAFTNMTALGFQNLAANGFAPLSAFTGNPADHAYNVALVGRDNDSGTRLGTTFETGYGGVNTAITQFFAWDGANGTGNNVGLTGSGTIASIATGSGVSGLGGYASGGQVKNVLNAPMGSVVFAGAPVILVGYVGVGDRPTATTQYLTYTGVAWSSTATQYGQYTYWTYEQAYYKTSAITAAQQTIIDGLASSIASTYASAASGYTLAQMQAARGSEGTVVNPF